MNEINQNAAFPRAVQLEKDYALPRSQNQPPFPNEEKRLVSRERARQVRARVVVYRIVLPRHFVEERRQPLVIARDVRLELVDEERARAVRQVNEANSVAGFRFGDCVLDFGRDVDCLDFCGLLP